MAGFFQQVLKGAADGFFNEAYLRDFRHASKTFTTNGFANAPKFKWLFHVYFDINPQVAKYPAQIANHGLLVKNIQLPKFNVTVAEMNQYNRKRNIQTKHSYDPVAVTFHDDNNGLIKKMWYDYYSYYYGDVTAATNKAGKRNIYDPDISGDQTWGYINEPSATNVTEGQAKPQFFNSIKIFGFNQHNFSAYTLNNPTIERFEHDTYDYYQTNSTMENRMTIRYESVGYEEGAINGQKPELIPGFGNQGVYDRLLSPISRPGGNKTIMGQGGLFDAGVGIIGDLSGNPPNLLGAAVKGLNVAKAWKNPSAILTAAKSELVSGVTTAAGQAGARAAANTAFNFPANRSK
jgi:hypothetical protein